MAFTDEIRIPITAEDRASFVFNAVRVQGEKLVAGFKKISKQAIAINQSLEIVKKVGHTLSAGIRATAGEFASFEKALVGVGKTTDLGGVELAKFGSTIQDLSQRIPVAANELLGIAETAGQLGVSGSKNLELFTETIAKVGVATNLSAEEAATSFSRILNVVGEPIDKIDEFASVVVALGNTFPATEKEIARMTNEVARSTSVFGLSSAEAAAFGTALRSVGVQAELGGSAVGRTMRTLDDAIRGGGESLEGLIKITGLTESQLIETFEQSSVRGFQVFTEGLQRVINTGGSASAALESIGLKGEEINKVIPVLAQRAELLSNALSLANKESKNATALNEEAAKAFSTLSAQFQKTLNAITNLGSDIGSVLAPALKSLLQIVEGLVAGFRAAFDSSSALNAGLRVLAVAVGVLTAQFVLLNLPAIALGFNIIWPAVALVTAEVALLAGGLVVVAAKFTAIALAVTASIAAVELFVLNFDKLGQTVDLVLNAAAQKINLARLQLLELGRTAAEILQGLGATDTGGALLEKVEAEQLAIAEQIQRNIDMVEASSKDIEIGFAGNALKDLFGALGKISDDLLGIKANADLAGNAIGALPLPGEFGPGADTDAIRKAAAQAKKAQIEADRAAKAAGDRAKAMAKQASRDAAQARKRQLADADRAFEALVNGRKDIEAANLKANATTRQLIDIEKMERLRAIDDFVAKQKIAGKKITDEQQRQIEAFRSAAEAEAEMKRETAGIGADSPFGGGAVESIGNAISGASEAFASSMAPVVGQIMQGITAAIGMAQQVIDFIPQVLDSITKLFTSLTELPLKIAEGIANLFKAAASFVSDFLPNIITMVDDILMSVADFLVEGLPDAAAKLAEKIPEAFLKLVDRLPELGEKLGLGFIRTGITLLPKLTVALVKAAPLMVSELLKAIPEMAMALVDGIILGLKEFVNEIAKALNLGEVFNIDLGPAQEQLAKLGDDISRSTANLFQVVDLEAMGRGLDVADRIRDAINSSTTRTKNIFERLWEALRNAWLWVWEKILKPIWDLVTKAWLWVWDNVIEPIWNLIVGAWNWVNEKIIQPIWQLIVGAWNWVNEKVIQPIWNMIVGAWNWVNEKIIQPIAGAISAAWNWVKENITDKLSEVVEQAFGWLRDMFKGISEFSWPSFPSFSWPDIPKPSWFGDIGGLVLGPVDKLTSQVSDTYQKSPIGQATRSIGKKLQYRATGGIVESYATADLSPYKQSQILYAQSGALAKGTDTVPAMLTPGEFVVNREATRNNIGLLSFINQTRGTAVPVERPTNISVVINTKTDLSPDQIRREVIPTLEKELRRKSLEGKFVIANSGVRQR